VSPLLQFFQRVVDLGTGNLGPLPYVPPHQLRPQLVTVHGTLSQQAENDQIRGRKVAGFRGHPKKALDMLRKSKLD
jgi:hypothetical protein